uniref:Hematopoietic cell signal transducer isoform X1 n=1 Tax=Camelus bactrianus TaxID=9837 RepID=A0A9W3FY69_CAMBA|nr:hematopoietic cell signal transducer isoform X1 [Camelus bactrianus]
MLIFPVAQARSLVILECCLSYILISTPSASFVGSNSKTLPESPQCPHPGLSVTSHLNYQNSLPGSLTLPPLCPQRQSQGSTSSSPPTHAHRKQVALSPARVTSAIAASLFPHCSSGPLWKQSPLPGPFQPPAYHGPFSGCRSDDPRFLFRMWAPLPATPGGARGRRCCCVTADRGGGVSVCPPTRQAHPRWQNLHQHAWQGLSPGTL